MNTTKKVKDGKIFTIYLDRQQLDHVKRVARSLSMKEGRLVSTCEVIRMAVEECYPVDQQLEFFPKKAKKSKHYSIDQLDFI